jgi:hypothetical protein
MIPHYEILTGWIAFAPDPAPASTQPATPLLPWWTSGMLIAAVLAVTLCAVAIARGVANRRLFWTRLRNDPARLMDAIPLPPMLPTIGGTMGVVVALLSFAGLIAPVELPVGGYRSAGLIQAAVAAMAGAALFGMLWERWNRGLADIGMALVTVAVCAVATVFIPAEPTALEDRFPLIFSTLIIALAVMAWLWTWLSKVWKDQLDQGRAWTTTGHLVAPAVDFSVQVAAIALIIAFALAAWPKLRGISIADDSFARVGFGLAAQLLLLLVLLWCGRQTQRTRFTQAAILGVVNLLIYIGVRAL